ncbi:hypothetical protein [Streptomyces albospinus]|uniref:hypothetical protein n=1 Tax=Streptomyces albospinus TaxID=285515 RepID=UPI001670BACD
MDPSHGAMCPAAERQDLDGDTRVVGGLQQPGELGPHHIGAADGSQKNRLIENNPRHGPIGLP